MIINFQCFNLITFHSQFLSDNSKTMQPYPISLLIAPHASTHHEFHNSYEVEMGLVGPLHIPCDCTLGGRNCLYSDTREHSPEDGKSSQVLVMCKTHIKVNYKTVIDTAPSLSCRGESRGRE